MFPKLVAFETSGVLFAGPLREDVWGKGHGAASKLADNIQRVDAWLLKDKSDHQNTVTLYPDVPRIIQDVLKNGAVIAIVSRTDSKALCDRALHYFKAIDPDTDEETSIIKLVKYDEVVDEPKTKHFKRIRGWSHFKYKDMLYFDNDSGCDLSQEGVIVRITEPQGLTWEQYCRGVEIWKTENNPNVKPPSENTGTNKKNELRIAHFNDVYQVSNQKLKINGKEENIDVTKFATLLSNVKKNWKASGYDPANGLTIFSGDTFSPSFQSSITRGRHMTSIMNALNVEISVAGNHEFDFGYRRLAELIQDSNFPWLLSNIIDTNTGTVPEPMKELHVLEKSGIRIGFIGLVEEEWIATITGWPDNFKWEDMVQVGKRLSQVLRDPNGPHKCDLVFALTHSRIPNDIKIAQALYALSPEAQTKTNIASQHGVDLLLGGHDHIYWISKGLGTWDGYDVYQVLQDAVTDQGDTLIVKSGTDFQELSEVTLTLKDTPPGSVRKKVIQSIKGIRHVTTGDLAVDQDMQSVVDRELKDINDAMAEPICKSEVELDARSQAIRTGESAVGNWIADALKPAYNEVLEKLGHPPVDGVIICMGDIRGDSTYSKGPITLGDLMQMLPFTDPMVVVEMTGAALWTTMESGLSKWPVQEGRFPAISGFRVEWKSSKQGSSRVQGIWLRQESKEVGPDGNPKLVDKEEIKRDSTRKYIISVGEYMAQGGDGYDILKKQTMLINGENGQSKSTLIRKFLLGAHFVNKVTHDPNAKPMDMQLETFNFISKARTLIQLPKLEVPTINLPQMPKVPDFKIPDLPAGLPKISDMSKLPNVKVSGFTSPFAGASPSVTANFPRPSAVSSFSAPALPSAGRFIPGSAQNIAGQVTDYADSGRRAAEALARDAAQSAQGSLRDVSESINAMHGSVTDLADAIQQTVIASCKWVGSTVLYMFALKVAEHEDMSLVDAYERLRSGIEIEGTFTVQIKRSHTSGGTPQETTQQVKMESDLPVISPRIDGRLKDLDGKSPLTT